MRKAIDRSFLMRLLQITGLLLALMTASGAGLHAQAIGADGAAGADCDQSEDPACIGGRGGSGESATVLATDSSGSGAAAFATGGNGGPGGIGFYGGVGGDGGWATAQATGNSGGNNAATAIGGNGGPAGGYIENTFGDDGGNGGMATALATGTSRTGDVTVSTLATGGVGGEAVAGGPGSGGDASASSMATSRGPGNASSSANATGGIPGYNPFGGGGYGGNATAMADASAAGGGTASANAVANSFPGYSGVASGAANATSNAETAKGTLAQAQSTADGASGEVRSTAKTSFAGVSVQSTAVAVTLANFPGGTSTASAAGGSADETLVLTDSGGPYAVSTALPDEAYATTLIDGASTVADALLGPRDKIFGTAILESNFLSDTVSSTFDFHYGGDLLLGLIDGSGPFSIDVNGVYLFESFVNDSVINLGSNWGPNIDLTLMVANGASGGFAIGGAVPETSTWAMMLLGFAGLGYAGFRWSSKARLA